VSEKIVSDTFFPGKAELCFATARRGTRAPRRLRFVDAVWIALGAVCLLVGFAGSVLPVLPGPPIAYLALLCASFASGWEAFTAFELIVAAGAVVVVTVLDFLIPVWGAKRYGASRAGVWCSMLGLLAGMFLFPPWGVIAGAFAGAFAGEIVAGKTDRDALRAAWGTFVGTLLGTGAKLACCGVLTWLFVARVWR
jgi:uncharacterized protein YqgC (DUF456 family)